MKIAIAQLNYIIGDFDFNTKKIISGIRQAKALGAELIVFSELSVCGYPPRDFLEYDDFIHKCLVSTERIAEACGDIYAIVGAPVFNTEPGGKRLYNAALLLHNSRVESQVYKSLLPNYDVFDEYRYFEPNRNVQCITVNGKKIALTICEDVWAIDEQPLYRFSPMDELMKESPELVINIAASPYHYHQPDQRFTILKKNALAYRIPVVYANQVGGNTELLFDGNSMAIDSDGKIVCHIGSFIEGIGLYDTDSPAESVGFHVHDEISSIHDALVMGISDYFSKLSFRKAILGLSGGIDSAVVLVLASRALGPENVLSLLLPSEYSTPHSISDAIALVKNLGSESITIPIQSSYEALKSALNPLFSDLPFDVAEENLQARIRANLLMAISNKFGYILLNTSNKSEAAVGYGTLYGDMCGGLSVLGDLYKTQVYRLARYINKDKEIIPENILVKPPSAELRPNQKDSDSLPEYDVLDPILQAYIEQALGPEQIIERGFDRELVMKVLKMVNANEWKRYQAPPALRVSPRAFGSGRRMPIVSKYLF